MLSQIRSLMKDESGATAIEYALLAAGVALGVGTAASFIGPEVKGIMDKVSTLVKAANKTPE